MRFFRRKEEPRPAPAEAVNDLADETGDEQYASEDESAEGVTEGEAEDEREVDAGWSRRAAAVIVGGASTGSKRREALYGEGAEFGPTHYERASGCELVTAGGRTLIDCTMALGAVAIGYADDRVTRAAVSAALAGGVSGLSTTFEVEVAERLCDVIPCAERVRFLKSGAEAVAAAVRIARTCTGRSRVVASGYFGWLDWASTAKGVPDGARADVAHVPFDDVRALEAAASAAAGDLAAIVVEPVVERLPSPAWLAAARSLCDRAGAVLIFDEIKTGFRVATGGYQAVSGVTPDVATFGKALANGFPLAAVVGRADVMEAASDTWISSTLAGEAVALAAANAVLDHHEAGDVGGALAERGRALREGVAHAIERSGIVGVTVGGIDPMWFLRWEDRAREQRFLELALQFGVLLKRGPYNFAALAHTEDIAVDVETAASNALVELLEEEQATGEEDGA